ncbi:hypothetical protein KIPB_010812, partial [Kipferlia bialata]|eukprot:g10812.t1
MARRKAGRHVAHKKTVASKKHEVKEDASIMERVTDMEEKLTGKLGNITGAEEIMWLVSLVFGVWYLLAKLQDRSGPLGDLVDASLLQTDVERMTALLEHSVSAPLPPDAEEGVEAVVLTAYTLPSPASEAMTNVLQGVADYFNESVSHPGSSAVLLSHDQTAISTVPRGGEYKNESLISVKAPAEALLISVSPK